MTKECSIVKGISIFLSLIGIASIAMAAIAYFLGPTVDLGIEDQGAMVLAAAVVLLFIGALELVTGVMGIRLSKDPARLKPFVVSATILTLVNLFEVFMKIGSDEDVPIWVNLLYAALAFTAIVYASRAMKGADAQ